MQLLACHIAIGGDDNSVVVRDTDNPVSYPEMLVLKALHGGEHVRHIEVIGEDERDSDAERSRLSEMYGADIIRQTFPGHGDLPEKDAKLKVRKVAKPEAEDDSVFEEEPKPRPARDKQADLPASALATKK